MAGVEKKYVVSIQRAKELPENSPLWVVNTSATVAKAHRDGGDILFQVRYENESTVLEVIKTWVPQLLTDKAPRGDILRSRTFMGAVSEGMITIVDTDYAQGVVNTDDAQVELDRIRNRAAEIEAAARDVGQLEATIAGADSNLTAKQELDLAEKASRRAVDANFKAHVMRMNDMTVKERLNHIRNLGRISKEQADYLIANITHRRIVALLQDKLENEA